ncbi:MAG: gliding motility-associated C-terminal domain-containing protein, partial [Bacteroidetes bacterium]|nr:gliding motility-associated C-terminal domain-containing protein [Bacteroidota bacterium]
SAARISQFTFVPGTSNRWKYAKLDLSSQFPAISNVLITNDSMVFHCGMINGKATGSGCRFGYFSNFRKVSPRLFGPDRMDLCSGADLKLQFNVIGQPGTQWVLPNKTTRTGSFFYQPGMRLRDSGLYIARYTNPSCDINVRDSVRVRMDSAAISFSAKPARCLGDSLIIRPSVFSLSGAGPVTWFYGTSNQIGPVFRLKPAVAGSLPVSAGFTTRNGCSMAWLDTVMVVDYPKAAWTEVSGSVCAGDSVKLSIAPGTWGAYSKGAGTQSWKLDGKTVSRLPLLRFKNPVGTGIDVALRISNAEGCADSVQQRRSIEDLKVKSIKVPDACAGEFVSLEAVTDWMNSTPASMTWFTGDGTVLTGSALQTHRYINAGVFNVKFLMLSTAGCRDSSTAKLNIHESPKPSFSVTGGFCFGDTLLLNFNGTWGQTSGSGSLEWFANGVSINNKTQFLWKNSAKDPLRLCVVAVNNQSCTDSAIQMRRVFDLPKLPINIPAVCVGDETRMVVQPDWGNGQPGSIRWFAHDRDTGSGLLFVKRYPNAGLYSVKCMAVSAEGCIGSREVKAKVDPSPRASFRYSPGFSGIDTPFTFSNTSTGASSWIWNPEPGVFLNSRDLVYAYPVGGYKKVLLIAVSDSGCRDTAEQLVFVREWIKFFIPNAFTPNMDDLNEVFRPVGLEGRVNRYEFRIFNRWGEKLYDGRDATKGWDGRFGGKLCQEGQYVYELYYRDYLGQAGYRKGSFLLLR